MKILIEKSVTINVLLLIYTSAHSSKFYKIEDDIIIESILRKLVTKKN